MHPGVGRPVLCRVHPAAVPPGDLLGGPGAMCQAQGWDISAGAIPPCYAMKSSRMRSIPSSLGPGKVLLLTARRRLGGGCCQGRSCPWMWRHVAASSGEEI